MALRVCGSGHLTGLKRCGLYGSLAIDLLAGRAPQHAAIDKRTKRDITIRLRQGEGRRAATADFDKETPANAADSIGQSRRARLDWKPWKRKKSRRLTGHFRAFVAGIQVLSAETAPHSDSASARRAARERKTNRNA